MNSPYISVYVTVSDPYEAKAIARHIMQKRVAACVNILPVIDSYCHWEGELREDREVAMVIKTRRDLYGALETAIREKHSYEVPCIVAWPITDAHQPYLDWIDQETRRA